ncbi:MAG: TolC family protein [Elusimicrobiota bacterium]|nr:TolC family protein [Elusimicrobiota bacterium]
MQKFIILLVIFTLVSPLFSAEILSWNDVLKESMQSNPQLKQVELNLQQTKLKLEQARSEFYPQISLGATVGKNYQENFESETNYSYNLSLGLTLFSGFSRINNLRLQIVELQIMQENYKRILANLVAELKEKFINVYYAQELVNLAEKILRRRKQNYELVKLKYESGREDIGSLLRVEADMMQAEYELRKAKRNFQQAVRELLKTIGRENFVEIKVNTNFDLTEDINKLILKDVETQIASIPEYRIKQYQLAKAKIQTKITKSNFYPTISVSAGYGLIDTKPIPEANRWNLSLGLRTSYNIFNGLKDINDLKIANINIKTAEIDLYDTKLTLRYNLLSLQNDFLDLKESINVKEKYLQALEKQAEIISVKYANGLATYYDWYQTEDSFINSQKNLLNLKKELIIAEINLRKFLAIFEEIK